MIARFFRYVPSPLSSALKTIKTYFNKGMMVKVQKTKEKSSYICCPDLIWQGSIEPNAYNGVVLNRPYTTPRL